MRKNTPAFIYPDLSLPLVDVFSKGAKISDKVEKMFSSARLDFIAFYWETVSCGSTVFVFLRFLVGNCFVQFTSKGSSASVLSFSSWFATHSSTFSLQLWRKYRLDNVLCCIIPFNSINWIVSCVFMIVYCLFHLTDGPTITVEHLLQAGLAKTDRALLHVQYHRIVKENCWLRKYFDRLQCVKGSPDQTSVTAP